LNIQQLAIAQAGRQSGKRESCSRFDGATLKPTLCFAQQITNIYKFGGLGVLNLLIRSDNQAPSCFEFEQKNSFDHHRFSNVKEETKSSISRSPRDLLLFNGIAAALLPASEQRSTQGAR
jgi:hypothetical protein